MQSSASGVKFSFAGSGSLGIFPVQPANLLAVSACKRAGFTGIQTAL